MKKQTTLTLTFPQITRMDYNRPEERKTEGLGRKGERKPKRSFSFSALCADVIHLHALSAAVTKSNDREVIFCRGFFNTRFVLFECYL